MRNATATRRNAEDETNSKALANKAENNNNNFTSGVAANESVAGAEGRQESFSLTAQGWSRRELRDFAWKKEVLMELDPYNTIQEDELDPKNSTLDDELDQR